MRGYRHGHDGHDGYHELADPGSVFFWTCEESRADVLVSPLWLSFVVATMALMVMMAIRAT